MKFFVLIAVFFISAQSVVKYTVRLSATDMEVQEEYDQSDDSKENEKEMDEEFLIHLLTLRNHEASDMVHFSPSSTRLLSIAYAPLTQPPKA